MNGRPARATCATALGREIRAENDADCFAASEAVDGAGAGHHVVFAVILGTGAGAGIAVGGRAHHGPNNSGGEWGHNPLPFPDLDRDPGRRLLLRQAWLHGDLGVRARLRGATTAGTPSVDLVDPRSSRRRDGRRCGRRPAGRGWSGTATSTGVARGLSVVVNTLDPDIFVMGGGMSNVRRALRRAAGRHRALHLLAVFYTPVVKALHGDSSGVRGAAWLWR